MLKVLLQMRHRGKNSFESFIGLQKMLHDISKEITISLKNYYFFTKWLDDKKDKLIQCVHK